MANKASVASLNAYPILDLGTDLPTQMNASDSKSIK